MHFFVLLAVIPLLISGAAEYAVCRISKRRPWRWLLPFLCLAVTITVGLSRYFGWSNDSEEKAPIANLLIIPGVPALVVFVGLFIGWRIWKHRWRPRII